jgi:predicted glycosyltransferase
MAKIWIDFENTPHVPFFAPIIERLQNDGNEVILTARDFAQTLSLLKRFNINAHVVGGEYGAKTSHKILGLTKRALQLRKYVAPKKPDLAVGHGSRGMLLAARIANIPSLTLYDYEGASVGFFNRMSRWVMTPEIVSKSLLKSGMIRKSKLLSYPGLKEQVYVSGFLPDQKIYVELRLDPAKILITIRPPSDTAHYRSDASDRMFRDILNLLISRTDVEIVISSRTTEQYGRLQSIYGATSSIRIPEFALDGLNLLYHSDLVIGGGGTMNREAAVLRVPVASIFKGAQGAVDRELVREGLMVELNDANELIPLIHKRERVLPAKAENPTLNSIVSAIEHLASESSR